MNIYSTCLQEPNDLYLIFEHQPRGLLCRNKAGEGLSVVKQCEGKPAWQKQLLFQCEALKRCTLVFSEKDFLQGHKLLLHTQEPHSQHVKQRLTFAVV